MKITLIKPSIGRMGNRLYIDQGRMEPLQLGVIAALTPNDIEVKLFDDRIDIIDYDEQTDLVVITVETFTAKRAYEIAEEYGQRNIPVIMGGMHPTLIPEEAKQHADSVYIGDAEFLWDNVIRDLKIGRLQRMYKSSAGVPQPGVFTRRDIFKGKGYLPLSLIQFSRGCIYQCNFCATSAYFQYKHYCRNSEEVIAEIRQQGLKSLFFVDDNFAANRTAAKDFLKALIPLKIRWVGQVSIDCAEDTELVELMEKSGCLGFVVGLESIYTDNLHFMNKKPNLKGKRFMRYESQLKILRAHGLQIWAAFTLGYDYDTLESIKETLAFALENKFCFAAFNILTPYPNTPTYEKLKRENRLLYDGKWWLHPEYRFNYAAFKPKNMTPDQLTEACFVARKRFNNLGSVIKRAFNLKTNMRSLFRFGVFITYNMLVKKEVIKKQGISLGITD